MTPVAEGAFGTASSQYLNGAAGEVYSMVYSDITSAKPTSRYSSTFDVISNTSHGLIEVRQMHAYALYALLFFVCILPSMRGQTPAANTAPLCKPVDVDATFAFAEAPREHQTIGVRLHNTTPQPCKLRGELAPSFAVDGHGSLIKTCWLCTPDGHPDPEAIQRNNNFILTGYGNARVTYSWSSVGDTCQKFDWATIGTEWDGRALFLFEDMHWRPNVCSTMQISGYEPDADARNRPTSSAETVLEVGLPPTPIYADEFTQLTLELRSSHNLVGPTGRCPELYAVYSEGSGSTRFEAILPDGYGALVRNRSDEPSVFISGYSDKLPANLNGYMRVCDTQGKRNTTTVTLPASLNAPIHVVPQPNLEGLRHIAWRAENVSTHEPTLVTADVHFDVLDPDTLPQNWGTQIAGIGVGLSVDRTTFTFGETIPLHLRWENFSASKKLAVGECGDPQPQVEIQDASHRVLGTTDFVDMGCNIHGFGPFSVELGKRHRKSASLTSTKMGYTASEGKAVITGPGTYYVSAVWSPPVLKAKNGDPVIQGLGSEYTFGEHYATARSLPVRIEILPRKN
jgi:hypothetical protein